MKRLAPPIVLDAVARARFGQRAVVKVRRYQGVTTMHAMRALHEGPFARAFDRAAALDPHHHPDVTRLRSYLACFFADTVKHVPGDFLSAGISFGVAPRTVFEFVDMPALQKTHHLVDAFAGVDDAGATRSIYNTDVDLVRKQYAPGAPVRFHKGLIPDCLPIDGVTALAFVQLNTGAAKAEAASLPYLYERLSPGGVLIIDKYAFNKGFQDIYDPVLEQLGAKVFTMVTGQGIATKPSA